MTKYLVTEPIATVYKTNVNGNAEVVKEINKGRIVQIVSIGEQKTPSGTIEILKFADGSWIKKSSAVLSIDAEQAKRLIANQGTTAEISNAIANSNNSTATSVSTAPAKSYKNIIMGVLAIGLVLGLLKWKKVI